MSDRDDAAGLLRAVIANPDDDLPRLLLCDWWEERGQQERANFCRVQCELAKCRHDDCAARGPDGRAVLPETTCDRCGLGSPLRRRERELLGACTAAVNAAEWNITNAVRWSYGDDTNAIALYVATAPVFTRGFPSRLTLSWADWHRHAAGLLAACPLTGKDSLVRLTTWPENVALCRTADGREEYRIGVPFVLQPGEVMGGADQTTAAGKPATSAAHPGVRFELPPAQSDFQAAYHGYYIRERVREAFDSRRYLNAPTEEGDRMLAEHISRTLARP